MRGLLKALRAALKALKRMVWRTIEIGGRLVSVLLPAPALPDPDEIADDALVPDPTPAVDDTLQAVRELAYAMSNSNASAAHFSKVHEKSARWLMAMPPEMLKLVVCTTDAMLRDHMKARRPIKGVLPYDSGSISEYAAAMQRERQREETRRLAAAKIARRYAYEDYD